MDVVNLLNVFLALAFVLALVGLFALLLRRFGPMAGVPIRKGAERRLGVVEVLALDARRRLVLVRRDGVEHLLLLGATDDLVVESGIRDGATGAARPGFGEALSRAGSQATPT